MCLGSFHTDIEGHGHLFAALSFGKKLHNFSLPAGKAIANRTVLSGPGFAIAKTVQHHLRDFCGEKCAVHGQSFHGVYQIAIRVGFKYVSAHPGLHYFVHQFIRKVQTQYYDLRIWESLANLPSRFKSVELWHPDIHHNYVWLSLERHRPRFTTS